MTRDNGLHQSKLQEPTLKGISQINCSTKSPIMQLATHPTTNYTNTTTSSKFSGDHSEILWDQGTIKGAQSFHTGSSKSPGQGPTIKCIAQYISINQWVIYSFWTSRTIFMQPVGKHWYPDFYESTLLDRKLWKKTCSNDFQSPVYSTLF